MNVDERIARDAAELRARRYHRTRAPISLADCVVLAAAGSGPGYVIATADRPLAHRRAGRRLRGHRAA